MSCRKYSREKARHTYTSTNGQASHFTLTYLLECASAGLLLLAVPPLQDDEAQAKDTWVYVGRHRSHGRTITGLEFGTREDGRVSLVSVGEDRCLVEYNLPESNQVLSSDS